ncbi:hypothetical protein [Streptomyces luteireticuli]|uniref:hypothetical protein n=1 Tax=Streptomyces luteireticuli TaxID=173858 RepID=UPI003555F833
MSATGHHPHLLSVETVDRPWGPQRVFRFREFTGHEPEPQPLPFDPQMPREDRIALEEELRAARELWNIARFQQELKPHLTRAAPLWTEYATAREAMDSHYAVLRTGVEDGRWNSRLLNLIEAHEATRAAAHAFDRAAQPIAALVDTYESAVGHGRLPQWQTIAAGCGIAAGNWQIHPAPDYNNNRFQTSSPLLEAVEQDIEQHNELLNRVGRITSGRWSPAAQ